MPRHVVDVHFGAFEIVEFFPDGGLVSGGKSRPGFVRVSIVVDRFGNLDVIMEPDDAFLLELFDRGSKREFSREDLFRFFPLSTPPFVLLVVHGRPEDVALFEFLGRRPERHPSVESDADDAPIVPPHFLRNRDENVPLEELLLARALAQETRQALLAHDLGRETTPIIAAVVVAVRQRILEKVIR